MTREEVAEWLEFMQEEEHNKADSIVPCTNEIALGIAIEALKQPQIVRCKDCKYCEACDDEETAEPLIFDGLIWCELHEFSRKPDYYCGDAERKEGDG